MNVVIIVGRGWKAEELRLKSFKDLHILWYVLLRERNLLASQKEETRRMGVENRDWQVNLTKVYHVGFFFLSFYVVLSLTHRLGLLGQEVDGTYQASH